MNKEQLHKNLWRYGKILKDIEYGTVRITLFSYDRQIWYTSMNAGKVIECHELKP